jgi:hypothetical protein
VVGIPLNLGESIDYTAWQDMTELPANIFPKLISEGPKDDEGDSEEADSSEESASSAAHQLVGPSECSIP